MYMYVNSTLHMYMCILLYLQVYKYTALVHKHVNVHAHTHDMHVCTHHWRTSKLTGGGGFRGSSRITLDSTFGGGRKLFLPI